MSKDRETTHVVKQGETLPGIAKKYGFGDWKKIYFDSANDSFRTDHPNPNVLSPDAQLIIPPKGKKTLDSPHETTNKFKVGGPKSVLKLVMKDLKGNPLKGNFYSLHCVGENATGQTNKNGAIEQPVPPGEVKAILTLWFGAQPEGACLRWELLLGGLDPSGSITGARARLRNLGFHPGPVDQNDEKRDASAIRKFQEAHLKDRKADGRLDTTTAEKLEEVHGC